MPSKQKWVKVGDFVLDKQINVKKVSYHNANTPNSSIESLQIFEWENGTTIEFFFPCDELFNECMHQKEGYVNFTHPKNRTDKWCVGVQQTLDKNKLREFIDIVNKYYPLEEIKSELYAYIGIELLEKQINISANSFFNSKDNNELDVSDSDMAQSSFGQESNTAKRFRYI